MAEYTLVSEDGSAAVYNSREEALAQYAHNVVAGGDETQVVATNGTPIAEATMQAAVDAFEPDDRTTIQEDTNG